MEGNSAGNVNSTREEYEERARKYMNDLRRIGGISLFVFIVYPFIMVFGTAFLMNYPAPLALLGSLYWLLFLFIDSRRWFMDRKIRGVEVDYPTYVLHSPTSQSYFKFSVLPMLIYFGEIFAVHVHMTAYEGAAFLVGVIVIIFATIFMNPWLQREMRHSRPLESRAIISRINEIAASEGMGSVEPRIIDGNTFKVANAYAVGAFRPKICITDYALENLTTDESVAILAHELSHLRRHDALRSIIPGTVILGAVAVMVAIIAFMSLNSANIAFLQNTMPILVQVWLVMVFAGLIIIPTAFRKQGQNAADRFAVRHTGPDDIAHGLIRMRHLNALPYSNIRGAGSMAFMLRITRLQEYSGGYRKR